jgi:DNA polymerase-3 subunit alpha
LAGFSLGEADILRKAMGKKKLEVMEAQRNKFIEGAVGNDVPRAIAERIWQDIEHFAGYGFNKSHSVAYAVISVQTAYLKAHYPAEYLAASLTSEMNNTTRVVILLEDCRRQGIGVLPPDVNSCFADFRVRDDKVLFGLGAIKNVGLGAIEAIVQARDEGGPFQSVFDFCDRVEAQAWNRRVLESLIMAGAMDELPGGRSQKMAVVEQAIARAQHTQKARARGQASLFGDAPELLGTGMEPPLPIEPEWDEATRLANEKAVLGFYLSGHPLDALKPLLRDLTTCSTVELQEAEENAVTVLAGAVASRKVIADKKGKRMAFVQLEDFLGSAELLVFSSTWERTETLFEEDAVVVVAGRANAREEQETKLLVEQVMTLDEALEKLGRTLHLELDARALPSGNIDKLKALLARSPGTVPVRMRLRGEERELVMRSRNTTVTPRRELIEAVRELLGDEHVYLECGKPALKPLQERRWRNGVDSGNGGTTSSGGMAGNPTSRAPGAAVDSAASQ